MKKIEEKKIRNLISYNKTSAYLRSDDMRDYAAELMEDEFPFNKDFSFDELSEWEENIQPAEENIIDYINAMILDDYDYIEYENQGDHHRHIWHESE